MGNKIISVNGTIPLVNGKAIKGNISSGLEYKSTAAEMNATLAQACEGRIYEYTGSDTTEYKSGRLYLVEEDNCLYFTAEEANSTIALNLVGDSPPTQGQAFETSTDGVTWSAYTPNTVITLTNVGDKVYFRGNNATVSQRSNIYFQFVMTGTIGASGNIMSLLDKTVRSTTISANMCFYNMFSGCTSLTTAPELPATTLSENCYSNMFYGCTSLTSAPELPATTLSENCYSNMFYGCTSLTSAPELPATALANRCYSGMFWNCTNLVIAPALPATTLANRCYSVMFDGCTSLTNAPELSATTLAESCYSNMFDGCTSLTTISELPATMLVTGCYYSMFSGCTSLTSVPELPATTLANNCYSSMFRDCTNLTTTPELPATTLKASCYDGMFSGCTSIKLSETQTSEYQYAYRIPSSGAGTTATYALSNMFANTGGAFVGTPIINTTYYTTNQAV